MLRPTEDRASSHRTTGHSYWTSRASTIPGVIVHARSAHATLSSSHKQYFRTESFRPVALCNPIYTCCGARVQLAPWLQVPLSRFDRAASGRPAVFRTLGHGAIMRQQTWDEPKRIGLFGRMCILPGMVHGG